MNSSEDDVSFKDIKDKIIINKELKKFEKLTKEEKIQLFEAWIDNRDSIYFKVTPSQLCKCIRPEWYDNMVYVVVKI